MATPGRPPTVLVAEDDPLVRATVRDALAELGCRVVAAHDGLEALELAAREPPDLVLADLDMPEPDGLTLCRMLAGWPPTRGAARVLVSGAVGAGAAELGCADAFLPKPFSLDELDEALARVLARP